MARKNRKRRNRNFLEDLEPYYGCKADTSLGLDPLAVGWLQRGQTFDSGPLPDAFPEALLPFCFDEHTVCARPNTLPCPLCGERVEPVTRDGATAHFGVAEIRVLGEDDIYASPTLIYHYVVAHKYRPPDVFVRAVMQGPQPGSAEHRAVVRTLNAI